jgi:hypothetical protein
MQWIPGLPSPSPPTNQKAWGQGYYCHRFAVNIKSHEQAIATDASLASQPLPQRGGACLYVYVHGNFEAITTFTCSANPPPLPTLAHTIVIVGCRFMVAKTPI